MAARQVQAEAVMTGPRERVDRGLRRPPEGALGAGREPAEPLRGSVACARSLRCRADRALVVGSGPARRWMRVRPAHPRLPVQLAEWGQCATIYPSRRRRDASA